MASSAELVVEIFDNIDWVSGLFGLGGTVIGGLITVWATERFTARNREAERKERLNSLAFALYRKFNAIVSDAFAIRNNIRTGILEHAKAEAEERKKPRRFHADGTEIKQFHTVSEHVRPWGNLPAAISFTPEEFWATKIIGGAELLNHVSVIDRQFNGLVESFAEYRSEYQKLHDRSKIMGPVEGKPGVAYTIRKPDEVGPFVVMAEGLDDMVLTIHEHAEALVIDTYDAINLVLNSPTRAIGIVTAQAITPDGEKVELSTPPLPARKPWFAFWKREKSEDN